MTARLPLAATRRSAAHHPVDLCPALDRLAFGSLWLFVLAVPMEGKNAIAGVLITRWLAIAALGTAVLRFSATGDARKPCALHAWMVGFALWASLSIIWTMDPEMTLSRIGSYAQLLIMVWLIWNSAADEEKWTALLYAYCMGACGAAVIEIRNLIGGLSSDSDQALKLAEYGRFAPEGFDQNEFALLLALSIPVALYLLTRRQSWWASALCWAQLCLGTVAILLTGSRAGLISLAGASVFLPFALRGLRKWKRRLLWAALPCAAVCAYFVVPANTWERLMTTVSEFTGGDLDHRTAIWTAGLDVFRQHSLLGVGAGAFAASVVSAIDVNYVAHNSFLSVLVELGVIGALVLAGLLASMFYVAVRMGGTERGLWLALLLTWVLGASSLTWEYRKTTWFLFGMLAASSGLRRVGTIKAVPRAISWPAAPDRRFRRIV